MQPSVRVFGIFLLSSDHFDDLVFIVVCRILLVKLQLLVSLSESGHEISLREKEIGNSSSQR